MVSDKTIHIRLLEFIRLYKQNHKRILFHKLPKLYFGFRMIAFFDVWSENAALFKRFMKINSNPSILYYGFNCQFVTLDIYT